jgi:hypothetical protein
MQWLLALAIFIVFIITGLFSQFYRSHNARIDWVLGCDPDKVPKQILVGLADNAFFLSLIMTVLVVIAIELGVIVLAFIGIAVWR